MTSDTPTNTPPSLAIVILSWNGVQMLRQFLPSVLAHTPEHLAHVFVADNGSADDTLSVLAAEFPQVRTIALDQNYGFAEGYNKALRKVGDSYPLYLLLNSDIEVPEGWLEPLLDYMAAHTDVAACQPKLRAHHTPTHFEYAGAAGGYIDSLGYPFCRGRVFDTVEADEGQYDQVADVFWATGAALLIRSGEYWEAGGLDGRFFAHQEEIDLCWRLRARGRRIACVPQSVVYHVGGGTLPKENPRKTFLNFRNNLLLLYKNLPAARLSKVLFVRFWLDALASLVFLLKGEGRSFIAVWKAHRAFRQMRRDFAPDREVNLAATVADPLPGQLSGSLLVAYHLRRLRTFAQLVAHYPL
ncbi:MAG: glycosyltransferase family 2 protein [Bacteroidaceae bacterium]|nr:glycosyltransferase family 2 protein [Bacteroidaceae bacterium]